MMNLRLSSIILLGFSLFLGLGCQNQSSSDSSDVLVFARPGDSVGLDPASHSDGESINILVNIFETLVTFKTGTTEIIPKLAKRWEVSDDGLKYTFFLREDVQFHDGSPFNADAVLFSFQRQKDTDHPAHSSGAPYQYWLAMGMSNLIKTIKKIDTHTIQFNLSRPSAPFLANLTMPFTAIVSPTAVKKYGKNFDQNPSGTGPYQLDTWKKDDAMVLKAFDSYWGETPPIERVVVRVIPDNQVRLLELKRGSVHIMEFPNPADLKSLKSRDDIDLLQQEGMNVGYLAFNMNKKPLDQRKVRKALSMAINRQRLVDEIFDGYAKVASNPIPPMVLGYNENVGKIPYDPEAAKKLLKEAGIKNLEIDLWAMPVARPYNPNARKMAQFIQADLKRVGVKANIVSYDRGTYLDKIAKGEHELVLIGWTGDNGDPDNFLYTLLSKESAESVPSQNYSFYKDEAVNTWMKRAQEVPTPSVRAQLYGRAIDKIMKDLPILPLAHSTVVVPKRSEVVGYQIHPTGDRRFSEARFKK